MTQEHYETLLDIQQELIEIQYEGMRLRNAIQMSRL